MEHFDFYQNPGSTGGQAAIPYSGLVEQDWFKKGAVRPDLASSWETSPDGLTVTFRIRTGVKWQDGTPFTAQDGAYALNHFRNPPKGVTHAFAAFAEPIQEITAPDVTTVSIRLKRPMPGLLQLLGTNALRIQPRHIIEREGNMRKVMMGTGPFKFKSHIPGVVVTFEKNPDYFIKGWPYLDEVRVHTISDPATAQAALQTGSIHVIAPDLVNLTLIPEIERNPRLAWKVDGRPQGFVLYTMDRGPFKDFRVRKAVHLAIDRVGVNRVMNEGLGQFGGLIPPNSQYAREESQWSSRPGWRQPKDQDIQEAKRLLAEAGYPNGFKETIFVRGEGFWRALGEFTQADLSKIGIRLDMELGGRPEWSKRVYVPGPQSGDYVLTTETSTMAFDSADQFLDGVLAVGQQNRYPLKAQQQPRFKALVSAIQKEVDPVKQGGLLQELEDYLLTDENQLYTIPFSGRVTPYFLSSKVRAWGHPWAYNKWMFTDVWLAK